MSRPQGFDKGAKWAFSQAKMAVDQIGDRLDTHERVCVTRGKEVDERLASIEQSVAVIQGGIRALQWLVPTIGGAIAALEILLRI